MWRDWSTLARVSGRWSAPVSIDMKPETERLILEIKAKRKLSFMVAHRILQLSEQPPSTTWQIGQPGAYAKSMSWRKAMTQREAELIVLAAKQRLSIARAKQEDRGAP